MSSDSNKYTCIGFLTILIWGTSAIFTRNLSTNIGAYTAAALVNLIGGVVVLTKQIGLGRGLKGFRKVPLKYWNICGSLFIIYTASSYVSMSMVKSDEAVVTLVLIRFLWPLCTLLLTIPILHAKASLWLIGSVSLCFAGIVVAKLGNDIFNLQKFLQNIIAGEDMPGFALGFVTAVSWGLYTNLTKKFMGTQEVDGVGIYMILTALVLGAISLGVDEPRCFSANLTGQILYAGVVVSALANSFWNLAIKKGNMLLVVLVSNFLPIISTIMTALMLGVGISAPIVVGSLMVVVGTIWSKKCFQK